MKKFNLHTIMKRAWEIKRQDGRNIFSFCLKMAWEEAKEEQKLPKLVGTPKQVAWAEKLRERHLEILKRELEKANAILIARGDKPLSGKRLKATMQETSAVYITLSNGRLFPIWRSLKKQGTYRFRTDI